MGADFATFISPGPELKLGPFELRWYGLLIACAVLIGLNLSSHLAKKKGLQNGLINDLTPILVLTSIVGARIYYVAFEWRNYSGENFWSSIKLIGLTLPIPSALEIWGGGIAIHGAILAGSLTVLIYCRLNKQPFWGVADVLVPSLILGQAIGRWGNFFNNEAFGTPTQLPWKLFIPYINRPLEFVAYEYFHPTFLYESLWNLNIFLLLIYLFQLSDKKFIKLPNGTLSFIYLFTYGLGRFWIERLRTDPLCIASLPPSCEGGIRMAQLMSIFFMLLGSFGFWWVYKQRQLTSSNKRKIKP